MISNSKAYRQIKAFRNVKAAQSKSIKARVLDWSKDGKKKDENGNIMPKEYLRKREIELNGVAYTVPAGTNPDQIMISKNMSDTELIGYMESITNKEENIKENDPPDYALLGNWDTKRQQWHNSDINYPDGWRTPIYPGGKSDVTSSALGKKPNIQMIRQWVEDVKLAGKSQSELDREYNGMYNQMEQTEPWSKEKMDRLVNSIAFVVARKIWYVGRKPSGMSDIEWDRDTKHMRPDEGTYSMGKKGQKYGYTQISTYVGYHHVPENFHNKYIESEYVYSSGEPVTEGIEQ